MESEVKSKIIVNKTHYLKTVQPFFDEVKNGAKTFEVRRNDRDFRVGDSMVLQEYDSKTNAYSGEEIHCAITYVLNEFYGLQEGYSVLSFKQIERTVKKSSTLNVNNMKIVNASKNLLPEYANVGDAGFDLIADIEIPMSVNPLERVIVPTGLFMQIPNGYVGMVCPRSGLAAKNGLTVLNAPGIVDSSYTGEVKVILINLSNDEFVIQPGDRIAQMVISPYLKVKFEQVDSVSKFEKTERGSGGFGSTGLQ